MITFDEVMESIGDGVERSLLMGNGFSQAWNRDIFDYANLLEAADFRDRNVELQALFDQLSTYDFERVMRALVSAEAVLTAYGESQRVIDQIETDQAILKDALIAAIASSHPAVPGDVRADQFISVRNFLSRFNRLFSVNYDLLLYWARNQDELEPVGYETDDGFRTQRTWVGYGTNQEVHFLHGGIHIYDSGFYVRKHAYEESGQTIIDQVRRNLQNGKFPLFVSEPTADQKRIKIERHPYLSYCYRALAEISGTLVIYGHSIDENEKHIFDQIKLSRTNRVFVSIFGDEHSESNARVKANARAYLEGQGITVDFYSAESTPVWTEPGN